MDHNQIVSVLQNKNFHPTSKNAQADILLLDAKCPSCRQVTTVSGNEDKLIVEEVDVSETYELGQISIVQCISCRKSLGLYGSENIFLSLANMISNPVYKMKKDGWHKIETEWERRILFVLNQIIYREYEAPDESLMEVEFAFPPPTDLVKLLWIDKQPVGFFSVKIKGTFDPYMMQPYTMTTLDTIFIRKAVRGLGWAITGIRDLRNCFPQENIGFSFPISNSMLEVLRKYLELTPSDRPRFWEMSGCGTEGNTRNLWLMFHQSKLATKTTTIKK